MKIGIGVSTLTADLLLFVALTVSRGCLILCNKGCKRLDMA